MSNPKAMLRRGWITAGNSELWNCRGTYCKVPYERLPRVERATDELGWLDDVSPALCRVIAGSATLDSGDNQIGNLESVVEKAQRLGLKLPQPFLRFMRDTSLQEKVPSCTACFLALSEDFVPFGGAEGHFLLRFLNDSQSCAMWYLCLGREGDLGVVVSDYFLEPEIFDSMGYEEVKREDVFRELLLCADNFTRFLYRFWVENTIWYSLHEGLPLTPVQKEYSSQITQRL